MGRSSRSYDARMGVWLSPDPILADYMQGGPSRGVYNPVNLSLYTQSWNSPTVHRDPDGRFVPLVVIGIAALVGGGAEAIRQAAAGEEFSLAKVGIAGGTAAVGAGVGMLTGGLGAAPFWAGVAGGAIGSGSNGVFQDMHDGEDFDLGKLVTNAAVGGVLGGALSATAHHFVPNRGATQLVDADPLVKALFGSVGVPNASAMVAAGQGDVAATILQGIVDVSRAASSPKTDQWGRPKNEQCDRLSQECYR